MSATYMHIGIPITNKKPGMVYNEGAKFWVSNVDDYDYKIEYLKFEEGTPFPEEIHRNPHVAYKVDDLEHYIADAAGRAEISPKGKLRTILLPGKLCRTPDGITVCTGGGQGMKTMIAVGSPNCPSLAALTSLITSL